MFRNYMKVALRNLWKYKGYSAINIFGLAAGLATCLLILIFVIDELSYDHYNKNIDRIYRVDGDIKFGGSHFILAVVPDPAGPELKKQFPQVEQYVRFRQRGGFLVRKGDNNIQENKVVFTDSSLFNVFTLPLIAGDARTALVDPKSMVITEDIARKYFNSTEVIGKTLVINDTSSFKISAVIRNIPTQSHFNFDFFVPMAALEESRRNHWVSNNFNTYLLMQKGTDMKAFSKAVDKFLSDHVAQQAKQFLSITEEEFRKSGNFVHYSLTPLADIHLKSSKVAEMGANGSMQYVYIFSAIALIILLIACVNFMNLSTARSSGRAREVGIRKVLGSEKSQLVKQFLSESVLISFISLLLALGLAALLVPVFNQLSGKNIHLNLLGPWMVPILLLMVVLVGLVAGSYPSFYLSSFQPIDVLKGKLATGMKGASLRSILVVFQFTISIILIIGTVVIYSQLKYIRDKELGYDRDKVLVVQNTYALGDHAKTFKDRLLNNKQITGVTVTGFLPTGDYRNDSPLFPDATLDQKNAVSMQNWYVDESYIPTLHMKLIKGRNFSADMPTDSSAIIINEAAAKLLGFTDPVDKELYYITSLQTKSSKAYRVIGLMKNFNFNSLREEVTPMALFLGTDKGSVAIRYQTGNIPALISYVQNEWKTLLPNQPFSYSFMDDDFNKIYDKEQRIGKIAFSFSILAILIACLGLLGLVTYAAEQRTKEIGIRKVLGASVVNIFHMLSGDFLRLVFISLLIAFPIAWWAMNKWLQDYAYRIQINWWVFVLAALIASIIAVISVSFQALKAALTNPVRNLRTE
ncbi:MAG: ABC transporter permease [Candidatus Dadabacteria bacterium]